MKFYPQVNEIKATFVVCDMETEQEVKKSLRDLPDVRVLSIGKVQGLNSIQFQETFQQYCIQGF